MGLRRQYYHGPVSDHFDGERFVDPNGMRLKRRRDVLRWWLRSDRGRWPAHIPNGFADRPPPRVDGNGWRICYVGHASLLIQTADHNLLIDPIWSERCSPVRFAGPKRVCPPGIAFEALPPIDTVLVSHNHYDHLALPTLKRLAQVHKPRILTPLGNDTIMRAHDSAIRAEAYDWADKVVLGLEVAVTLCPVRHWSARVVRDHNRALWAGFVIDTPAGRIFHVGDSGYG